MFNNLKFYTQKPMDLKFPENSVQRTIEKEGGCYHSIGSKHIV